MVECGGGGGVVVVVVRRAVVLQSCCCTTAPLLPHQVGAVSSDTLSSSCFVAL